MTDLNHRSAVEIMGWHIKESIDEYGNKVGEWFNKEDYTGFDAYCIHSDGEYVSCDLSFKWTPLTDLNQCMEIIRKLRGLHYNVSIYLCDDYKNGLPIIDVTISYSEKHPNYPRGRCIESGDENAAIIKADTLNEAILTAALEAKAKEKK